MSDRVSDDSVSKAFDISKLNIGGEGQAARDERSREQLREIMQGSSAVTDTLRAIGGSDALQDAIASINQLEDALRASGIGTVQAGAVDTMSSLAKSGILDEMSIPTSEGVMNHLMARRTAAEEAMEALGILPDSDVNRLTGVASAAAVAASDLQDRMRNLGLGEESSFSRIAAGIAEQQSILDEIHRDRQEMIRGLDSVHIPENPIVETNRRLVGIERRFDQVSHVAETAAKTAMELQLAAAEFLKDFKEAASKNDEAAADAIRLGKGAMWAAILIPFLVFGAQIAANAFIPNQQTEALRQAVSNLQNEINAIQAASGAETQSLIDALAASDEATAAAITEGLRALQLPAANPAQVAE